MCEKFYVDGQGLVKYNGLYRGIVLHFKKNTSVRRTVVAQWGEVTQFFVCRSRVVRRVFCVWTRVSRRDYDTVVSHDNSPH